MRLLRAILGLVFGDAYGLQYECLWPSPRLSWLDPKSLGFGCVDECDSKCCYSDDTELAVAVAECFLSLDETSPTSLARCLAERVDIGLRVRYFSLATKEVLSRLRSGYPWMDSTHSALDLCRFDPSPAVRAIAIASIARSLEEALALGASQAVATHVCREAIERAMVVAALVEMVVGEGLSHRVAIEELPSVAKWSSPVRECLELVPSIAQEPPYTVVARLRELGATAVELGLVAAYGARDPVEALARAISLGGDVDTAAAIACSLTSASTREPPHDLLQRVEGIERLRSLSARLALRRAVMKAS